MCLRYARMVAQGWWLLYVISNWGKKKYRARIGKTGPIKRKRKSLPACRCCRCLWAAGASAGAGAFTIRVDNNAGVGAANAVSALTHLSWAHACVRHKNTRPLSFNDRRKYSPGMFGASSGAPYGNKSSFCDGRGGSMHFAFKAQSH